MVRLRPDAYTPWWSWTWQPLNSIRLASKHSGLVVHGNSHAAAGVDPAVADHVVVPVELDAVEAGARHFKAIHDDPVAAVRIADPMFGRTDHDGVPLELGHDGSPGWCGAAQRVHQHSRRRTAQPNWAERVCSPPRTNRYTGSGFAAPQP